MIAFLGVGDLATFLGVAQTSLNVSLADLAVAAAQQRVRRYVDQEITFHLNDTVLLDGNGTVKIRLPERPVRQVISVEEGIADPTWELLSADNYTLRDSILIRWDGSVWTHGVANLRVVYHHGWNLGAIDSDTSDSDYDTSVNNIPADISLATLSLARRMYESMGQEASVSGDIKHEQIGAYSYTLSTAAEAAAGVQLITAEKAVLDAYKFRGAG